MTIDGEVVRESDPRSSVKLAAKGDVLSDEMAKRYGLKTEQKAVEPTANKAITQKKTK